MEFDKSKILTVVTGNKELEGKFGWFGDTPTEIKENMSNKEPEKLLSFDETCPCPFEAHYLYNLFYPAPESTYAERQAEWVKQNNVKKGTKVRVTRTFTENEDGSRCREHNDLVGIVGSICKHGFSSHYLGITMSNGSVKAVPYFALEVIKEPTYRPFNTGEEFKPFKDKWVLYNQATRRILSYNNIGVIIAQCNWDDSGVRFITFETAFKEFRFEDGTPFGEKES